MGHPVCIHTYILYIIRPCSVCRTFQTGKASWATMTHERRRYMSRKNEREREHNILFYSIPTQYTKAPRYLHSRRREYNNIRPVYILRHLLHSRRCYRLYKKRKIKLNEKKLVQMWLNIPRPTLGVEGGGSPESVYLLPTCVFSERTMFYCSYKTAVLQQRAK